MILKLLNPSLMLRSVADFFENVMTKRGRCNYVFFGILVFIFFLDYGRDLFGAEIVRDQSLSGNYIVESNSMEESRHWLDLLEEARGKLVGSMGLEAQAGHRILLHVEAKEVESRFQARVEEGRLDFFLTISKGIVRKEFLRMIARVFIYEQIIPKSKVWVEREILPEIPYWLIEGVMHQIDASDLSDEEIEKIVRRATMIERVPSLKQVLSWDEAGMKMSLNRGARGRAKDLESLFQRSFCVAFLRWRTEGGAHRSDLSRKFWETLGEDFGGWIDADHEELESRWIRFLGSYKGREELLLSWEETERAVANLLFMAIPQEGMEEKDRRLVSWDELRSIRWSRAISPLLQERENELMLLEAEAHFAWRPFLFDYRSALRSLAEEFQDSLQSKSSPYSRDNRGRGRNALLKRYRYEDFVKVAKRELSGVQERGKKSIDYLDWFVVNFSSDQDQFFFEDYFQEVDQLNRHEVSGNDPYRKQGIRLERRGE